MFNIIGTKKFVRKSLQDYGGSKRLEVPTTIYCMIKFQWKSKHQKPLYFFEILCFRSSL